MYLFVTILLLPRLLSNHELQTNIEYTAYKQNRIKDRDKVLKPAFMISLRTKYKHVQKQKSRYHSCTNVKGWSVTN